MRWTIRLAVVGWAVIAWGVAGSVQGTGLTEVVTRADPRLQKKVDGSVGSSSLTRDGRFVAFDSGATNLVVGDTNLSTDVFVVDRQTARTTRVSVDSTGGQGNNGSYRSSISADGRFVAFLSEASNLVVGDTNGRVDLFVHDRETHQTTRLEVGVPGTELDGPISDPVISANGRFIAFSSWATHLVANDTNRRTDVFVVDRLEGGTTRVSVDSFGRQADDDSDSPRLSADGRYVVFASKATNLAPGSRELSSSVFIRDRLLGTTERIWVVGPGVEELGYSVHPDISEEGRFVAFTSATATPEDTNFEADVFVHDRQTGVTTRVSISSSGAEGNDFSQAPRISPDGRFVAFNSASTNLVDGDVNGRIDVFLHDRASGTTTRMSVADSGEGGDENSYVSAISAGGQAVVFTTGSRNLISGDPGVPDGSFLRDNRLGTIERVPKAPARELATATDGSSGLAAVSAEGRYVAYVSRATNLVPGDTNRAADAFVTDLRTGQTTRVSVDSAGGQANADIEFVDLSADGELVVFSSRASNLVPPDTNSSWDVFLHDRRSGATTKLSVGASGAEGNGASWQPRVSADGRFVAFTSNSTNLVAGDVNGHDDVLVRDRETGLTTLVSVGPAGIGGYGDSASPAISADGRYVAFVSSAVNLVPGDGNGAPDVFVHDRVTGVTTRVSVDSLGGEGNALSLAPALSADGRYVAFASWASNLVPGDQNGVVDVFVRDRVLGATTRVSVNSDGTEAEGGGELPAISVDGRWVAFSSYSRGLVAGGANDWSDIYLHDRLTSVTSRESAGIGGAAGSGDSRRPALTPDARYLAFESDAHNLGQDNYSQYTQVLLRDRGTGPCEPSATTACLRDGRFEVRVDYRTAGSGGAGEVMSFGGVRAENRDSAFFSFFSPTNFEMGLKVLDACVPELGNRFWVFASGLTDQGWTVRVRDTATGEMQRYDNALGDLSSTFRDASSFSCGGAESTEAELAAPVVEWVADASAPLEVGALAPRAQSESCVPNATTSCLQGGRFRVRANWQTQAANGSAAVMSFLGARAENVDSVFFSFFGATNFELGLKVLDACVPELGDDFWVFASGLTDQGWAVTVEDLVNGRVQSYRNAVGTLSTTFRDPTSFPCQ
ncbi:MAG: PD40 domain-containing protein [Holophagales bacterium]|nr:MAG: PD40 domain-containing protein [Holophagales bacterium]